MTIRLLGRTEIRHLAKELDFRPRKAFGQNFVHDANTVRRIVSASGVNRQSHVLEVGPGLGSLTLALLDRGAKVTAVEIDPVLARQLPDTETVEFLDSRQGLAWCLANDPDLLLVDYMMPELDGMAFIEAVVKSSANNAAWTPLDYTPTTRAKYGDATLSSNRGGLA